MNNKNVFAHHNSLLPIPNFIFIYIKTCDPAMNLYGCDFCFFVLQGYLGFKTPVMPQASVGTSSFSLTPLPFSLQKKNKATACL